MKRRLVIALMISLLAVGAGALSNRSPVELSAAEATDHKPLKPLPKFLRSAKLAERYLSTRDIGEVVEFERTEPVCEQLLTRSGVSPEFRLEAAVKLAEIKNSDAGTLLIARIKKLAGESKMTPGQPPSDVPGDLARLLPGLEASHLAKLKPDLTSLADSNQAGVPRQAALIALAIADHSSESVWKIARRSDGHLIDLLSGLKLLSDNQLCAEFFTKVRPIIEDNSSPDIQVAAIKAIVNLEGDMLRVFDRLAEFVSDHQYVEACIEAINRIPVSFWDKNRSGPLANSLVEYVRGLPLADRSTPAGKQAFELIRSLAKQLPGNERDRILSDTILLTVQSFAIRALPEKMAYDVTVLVVEAGRPAQIVFRNDDIMPHNLVIGGEPAARVELGLLADQMQNDPDALSKGYVPNSDKLLFATKLIQPGQTDSIEFILPNVGVFPFVCTFPGHWSKMYGAIKVVPDANAYAIATQPLPSADDLLGIRTVAWKYEELAVELDQVNHSRSFSSGERWFREASCFSCHRVRGQGGIIGPDLTEIKRKYKLPDEVLLHIMDPSKSIDDAYAAVTVRDANGKVHQGVVLRRTDTELFLQPNPLGKCEPITIRIEDIEEESKSKVSAMPEKLLNTILTKAEVDDLLAYIIAGGDSTDPMFSQN